MTTPDMTMPDEIALFPLNTVLYPYGRIELQVFEARYMDLVKSCLRADEGFGIVLIKSGSEVFQPGRWRRPELVDIGCYGRIVDWDALPQGRLGLVLEGRQKFRIIDSAEDASHLLRANVEWFDPEPEPGLPMEFELFPPLLERLAAHASVRKLGMEGQPHSASHVANQLAQLLHVGQQEKQQLLALEDPIERLQLLEQLLAMLEA